MNKLYNPIEWENGTTPAINEDNLNAISQGLSDVDDRVITLSGLVLEDVPVIIEKYEEIEALSENPAYIGANGNWYIWDTETGAYVDSGVEAQGPQGETGEDGFSPEVTITAITGGHTVTITDKDHPSGQSFNVMDGGGAGDMSAATYDPQGAVANAGGIPAYVSSQGSSWSSVTNKPFSTVGNGLTVTSDALTADVKTVTVDRTGTASASAVSYQRVGVNGSYTTIDGTRYMEQTQTVSTSADTTYTFTNAAIIADSDIDVRSDVFGISPSNIVTTAGQCVVTIPAQATAFSLGIRIWIR